MTFFSLTFLFLPEKYSGPRRVVINSEHMVGANGRDKIKPETLMTKPRTLRSHG